MSSNLLTIGQKLSLIKQDDDEISYTVKKGDTLYKISNEFNVSINTIKKLNNLNSDSLIVGQKLIIKPDPLNDNTSNKYVVK